MYCVIGRVEMEMEWYGEGETGNTTTDLRWIWRVGECVGRLFSPERGYGYLRVADVFGRDGGIVYLVLLVR